MKILRLLWWFGFALMITFVGAILVNIAHAYDATGNFSQPQPELVSGFYFECGPTPGGPYPSVTDCGKPTPKIDKTYDCIGKNFTANPLYCVVSNYDSAKKKMATSTEATMTITVQPPSNLKLVITVTTISRLNRYGNPVATTTIKRVSVPSDKVVKEGTSGYWNSKKREYVTNTVVVSG